MSPVSAAAQVPTLVSLFDLNADAPVLQGLNLVSHPSGEALAQALRTSCPGIWEGLGRIHEVRDTLFRAYCSSREHVLIDIPQFKSPC